jgi:hypothetical protein
VSRSSSGDFAVSFVTRLQEIDRHAQENLGAMQSRVKKSAAAKYREIAR